MQLVTTVDMAYLSINTFATSLSFKVIKYSVYHNVRVDLKEIA